MATTVLPEMVQSSPFIQQGLYSYAEPSSSKDKGAWFDNAQDQQHYLHQQQHPRYLRSPSNHEDQHAHYHLSHDYHPDVEEETLAPSSYAQYGQPESSLSAFFMDDSDYGPRSSTLDSNSSSLQDWTAFRGADVYDPTANPLESPAPDLNHSVFYTPPESPASSFFGTSHHLQDSDHFGQYTSPALSSGSPAFPAFGSFRDCPSPYISSSQDQRYSLPSSPNPDAAQRNRSTSNGSEMFAKAAAARANRSFSNSKAANRHSLSEISQPYSLAQRRDRHRPSLSISVSRSSASLTETLGMLEAIEKSAASSYGQSNVSPQELHFRPPILKTRPTHRHSQSVPVTPIFRTMPLNGSTRSTSGDSRSAVPAVDEEIRAYIFAEDKLALGERTVVLLNANVAQRSYGNERRRVIPPPTALLLGASWWSSSTPLKALAAKPEEASSILRPPKISIDMSAASLKKGRCRVEWLSHDGDTDNVMERDAADTAVISGRAVAESCSAGSGQDEDHRIKCSIEIGEERAELLGTFASKPLNIVSKMPKRPSPAPGMHLLHGSTVCLYHRSRSSTLRYLSVSGSQTLFPMMDWRSATGGKTRPFAQMQNASTFSAESQSWDAFIIYAVDLNRIDDGQTQPDVAAAPHWPRPPVRAMRYDAENPFFIHYNQLVVLQCIATAVVSPVMIVRRVDGGSTAVGGGSPGPTTLVAPSWLHAAPGETLGDAVTPTRPLAFEIYKENATSQGIEDNTRKSFLACFDTVIGLSHTDSAPSPYMPLDSPSPNDSPLPSPGLGSPMRRERGSFSSRQAHSPLTARFDSRHDIPDSASGSPNRQRVRHASSTSALNGSNGSSPVRSNGSHAKTPSRGRSTSNLSSHDSSSARLADLMAFDNNAPCWSLDLADNCLWSMVGVNVDRFTFYIPPSLKGRTVFSRNSQTQLSNHLHQIPVPTRPINSDEIPRAFSYARAKNVDVPDGHDPSQFISLRGERFTSDLSVWLGPYKSPLVICRSSSHLLVQDPLPRPLLDQQMSEFRRIVLCRSDGVAFPSSLYYFPSSSSQDSSPPMPQDSQFR